MPLDPFFAERLRVHRRYLIDRGIAGVRSRLAALWPFGRASDTGSAAGTAAPRADEAALSPRARARAKHRRAALAWDRTELRTVGTPGPDLRTDEHRIARRGIPPFRVRIYYPDEATTGVVPAALAFFGGGFRIGGIDYPTTDAGFRRRAADAGVALVAVDYALAPEHRYPVPLRQAETALDWLFDAGPSLGLDLDRVGVIGTSAGGSIAAALTLRNRDGAAHPLRVQVLEVPVVDLTGAHLDLRATRAMGIPSVIARRELRSVARTYLPRAADAKEADASPLRAASHAGLPPAVILTAEYDPLRGDGEAYGAALRAAGVDASVVRYLGVTHDTPIFTGALPAARRWHDEVVTALRRLHR